MMRVGLIGCNPGPCHMTMICDCIYKLNPNLRTCCDVITFLVWGVLNCNIIQVPWFHTLFSCLFIPLWLFVFVLTMLSPFKFLLFLFLFWQDDLLVMIGVKNPNYEFLRSLFSKCSSNIFSSEHVQCILDYYLSNNEGEFKDLKGSSGNLLLVIKVAAA